MGIPSPGRRPLILAAIAAGLLVATAAVILYGIPYKRHLEVQRQLAAFRADPSQDNADLLTNMFLAEKVNQADGQDILRSILDLKAVLRKSYRPNAPIFITLASGNKTALAPPGPPDAVDSDASPRSPKNVFGFMMYSTTLHVPGLTPAEGHLNSESVHVDPSLSAKIFGEGHLNVAGTPEVPQPPAIVISKPGAYPGVLVLEGMAQTVTVHFYEPGAYYVPLPSLMDRALILLGLKDNPDRLPPEYHCVIEVPLEIHVEDGPDQADDDEPPAPASKPS